MADRVPFVRVLAMLEEHDWDFTQIKKPFCVFSKRGQSPILVQVHDNMVDPDDYERVKRAIEEAKKGP